MRPKAVARVAALITLASWGCAPCEPSQVEEQVSPDGAIHAAKYRRECGPMAPFDARVALRRSTTDGWSEVAKLRETPYTLDLAWVSHRKLRVTLECPHDTRDGCLPYPERGWLVKLKPRWRDVSIEYALGPKLAMWGGPDLLSRLTN